MAITAATKGNPMSGLIRPDLPVLFSNGFEDADFSDWDSQVEISTSTADQSVLNPRSGAKALACRKANGSAYMLEGLSVTAREIELDFWLALGSFTTDQTDKYTPTANLEVAPGTSNAECGIYYNGSAHVPYVTLGASQVVSTNVTIAKDDSYAHWVLRGIFTGSYASLKLFVGGVLAAESLQAGDKSSWAPDQITLGPSGGTSTNLSFDVDDFIVRGRA